jgi:hypothetical protein
MNSINYKCIYYQSCQLHVISGDTNSIYQLFHKTILDETYKVIDILFDHNYVLLNELNNRPYTKENNKLYRTRFHPINYQKDTTFLLEKIKQCIRKDSKIGWLLHSLYETKSYYTIYWILYSLGYINKLQSYRHCPMKYILIAINDINIFVDFFNKLHIESYVRHSHISFNENKKDIIPTIHTVNKRLMDNFIFNYEDDNVDNLEEEDSIVIVEKKEDTIAEEKEDTIAEEKEDTIAEEKEDDTIVEKNLNQSDNCKIDNLNQSDKKRCLIIIQNGYRKGELCNRNCQDNMIVCGIHNYYNDKNK